MLKAQPWCSENSDSVGVLPVNEDPIVLPFVVLHSLDAVENAKKYMMICSQKTHH